jgi:hypothetical protein
VGIFNVIKNICAESFKPLCQTSDKVQDESIKSGNDVSLGVTDVNRPDIVNDSGYNILLICAKCGSACAINKNQCEHCGNQNSVLSSELIILDNNDTELSRFSIKYSVQYCVQSEELSVIADYYTIFYITTGDCIYGHITVNHDGLILMEYFKSTLITSSNTTDAKRAVLVKSDDSNGSYWEDLGIRRLHDDVYGTFNNEGIKPLDAFDKAILYCIKLVKYNMLEYMWRGCFVSNKSIKFKKDYRVAGILKRYGRTVVYHHTSCEFDQSLVKELYDIVCKDIRIKYQPIEYNNNYVTHTTKTINKNIIKSALDLALQNYDGIMAPEDSDSTDPITITNGINTTKLTYSRICDMKRLGLINASGYLDIDKILRARTI